VASYGPGSAWEIIVAGPRLPRLESRGQPTELRFDTDRPPQRTFGIYGTSGGMNLVRLQASIPGRPPVHMFVRGWAEERLPVGFNLDPAASSITLETARMAPLTLQHGPLEELLGFLRECESGLARQWGFAQPTAQEAQLSNREVLGRKMFYPENLLLNRVSAIVQFRVTVGEDGKAEDCVMQAPNWESRFKRDTCSAIRRHARFEPARDSQGKPVPGLFRASTMFLMDAD
jgi:hypothetical protein